MASDERVLASWLAGRDDGRLAQLFVLRGVPPTAGWHDLFDAAEGLLEPASIDRALIRMPRRDLIALGAAPATDRLLADLALVDDAGRPYDAVAARVRALAAQHPEAFQDSPATPPTPADERSAAAAAERAFTTAAALADVLLASLHTPLARTGSGTVSAADRKRLAEAGIVGTAEELDDLLESASAARLARPLEREWSVTPAGEQWLEAPTAQRWAAIVEGMRRALPAGLVDEDGRVAAPSSWSHAYPLDPEWPARAVTLRRIATRWGLLTADGTEPVWTTALRETGRADAEALAAHLPAEVDRVYLQADLTAIAPGPLAPALDLRLRRIAVRESRAQASTYRFTAASVAHGLTEGETADSIRDFLASVSLTGIPQPLDYLVESTAARHGLVRVRSDARTGRTCVEVADPALRDTIAVDQALRPLGLVDDGEALVSRVARDAVYWSLADARYPVVAIAEDGSAESLHRRVTGTGASTAPSGAAAYSRLIETLRAGHGSGGEDAWLGRELEQAVRARAEIVVVVRMPDGSERSLMLEASGLGGGRLRGRDRAADTERTLPVSSIITVRPA